MIRELEKIDLGNGRSVTIIQEVVESGGRPLPQHDWTQGRGPYYPAKATPKKPVAWWCYAFADEITDDHLAHINERLAFYGGDPIDRSGFDDFVKTCAKVRANLHGGETRDALVRRAWDFTGNNAMAERVADAIA